MGEWLYIYVGHVLALCQILLAPLQGAVGCTHVSSKRIRLGLIVAKCSEAASHFGHSFVLAGRCIICDAEGNKADKTDCASA
jgi:hypothetical protein